MYDAMHRAALAALFIVGLAMLVALGHSPADSVAAQHRQLLLAIVAASLLAASWIPMVRLPAAVAGVVAKASLVAVTWATDPAASVASDVLQLLALVVAGAVLVMEARLEARWNGV